MSTNAKTAHRSVIATITRGALWCLWQAIRLPLLAFLIVLEPIVRIVLSGFALVSTFTAFLFEFESTRPDFPFWGMLAISLGCVGALALYSALIRVLSA